MNGNAQDSQAPPPVPPPQYPDLKETALHHHHHHHHQPPPIPPSSSSTFMSPALIEKVASPHYGPDTNTTDHCNYFKGKDDSEIEEKWGTHVMGTPAVPTCHPNNQKAALWGASAGDQYQYQYHHYPYLQYTPPQDHGSSSSSSSILQKFNSWSRNAEATANNIWHNRTSVSFTAYENRPSVPGAAWAKVNLTAKVITGGGFESLYKQTFNTTTTFPNEKLKKTFACYLSTSTGPVAGTLYLSNIHVAFCSDRPLSFTAPSGQQTWSYYKVLILLGNIGILIPVIMTENPTERYIQAVTVDGQDFWFMGFVNYEKATLHLFDCISSAAAVSGIPLPVKQHPVAA